MPDTHKDNTKLYASDDDFARGRKIYWAMGFSNDRHNQSAKIAEILFLYRKIDAAAKQEASQ